MKVHPLRSSVVAEVHARPFQRLPAPLGLIHISAVHEAGEEALLYPEITKLASLLSIDVPESEQGFFFASNDEFALRFENHNEFYSLTLYQFGRDIIPRLPFGWDSSLPGLLLNGVEVVMTPPQDDFDQYASQFFQNGQINGAFVMGNKASVRTDFKPHPDSGYVRVVVEDLGLQPQQAGRLLQRITEVETYRHLALLALPLAQQMMPKITQLDQRLANLVAEIDSRDPADLLQELMELAVEVEGLLAKSANRFSAADAYFSLVTRRITELRENRIEGIQYLAQFMDRRLDPAMRTCRAAGQRIERLSKRIARTTNLIRSQVELAVEQQNRDLLEGLNVRARRQLKMQAKLESFTIIVVTYYAFDLIERSVRNTVSQDAMLDQLLFWLSVSVPLIAGVLWWYVRRLLKGYDD